MKLGLALLRSRPIVRLLASMAGGAVLATMALAVPVDDQAVLPYDDVAMADPGLGVLFPTKMDMSKFKFVHGPTDITMGYISVPLNDCDGLGRTESYIHGPTNITMGYVTIQSDGDCILSGSTDPRDQYALLTAARKVKRFSQSLSAPGGNATPTEKTSGGTLGSGSPPGGGGGSPKNKSTPPSVVPLPATLPFLLTALVGLCVATRRRKSSAVR